MVIGLDKFRDSFRAYSDKYVIIGGTACDVALDRTSDDIQVFLDVLSDSFTL